MINKRQKGRQLVVAVIRKFKDENDLYCYEVVGSGSGLEKGDIRVPNSDLVIEAKKHAKTSISSWAKQSEKEGLGYNKTALAWQIPNTPHIRIDIDIDYFIDLLKSSGNAIIKSEDRDMKYALQNLKNSINGVLKRL